MSHILDRIIEDKKLEVQQRKTETPVDRLETCPYFERETRSLVGALGKKKSSGIIAEFKRKSPSAGWMNRSADPVDITSGYIKSGAAALSVLTDTKYFGGSRDDLMRAREVNASPILRKDFIIDEYQVIEAKAIGADAVLLIAAVLSNSMIMDLARLAHSHGMEVILEVHEPSELALLNQWVDIVGVNNRDLKKMKTDVRTSMDMAGLIPPDFMRISESGINDPETIHQLKQKGYNGFLIGERFMKKEKPAKACRKFIEKIREKEKDLRK
jgi:indole-3-glycerol phosphate synthase